VALHFSSWEQCKLSYTCACKYIYNLLCCTDILYNSLFHGVHYSDCINGYGVIIKFYSRKVKLLIARSSTWVFSIIYRITKCICIVTFMLISIELFFSWLMFWYFPLLNWYLSTGMYSLVDYGFFLRYNYFNYSIVFLQKLIISLHEGRNIPSLLQALGCISQYSFSTYELYDEQIMQFIVEKIFCSLEVSNILSLSYPESYLILCRVSP